MVGILPKKRSNVPSCSRVWTRSLQKSRERSSSKASRHSVQAALAIDLHVPSFSNQRSHPIPPTPNRGLSNRRLPPKDFSVGDFQRSASPACSNPIGPSPEVFQGTGSHTGHEGGAKAQPPCYSPDRRMTSGFRAPHLDPDRSNCSGRDEMMDFC